jgi:hypothetical protein
MAPGLGIEPNYDSSEESVIADILTRNNLAREIGFEPILRASETPVLTVERFPNICITYIIMQRYNYSKNGCQPKVSTQNLTKS